MAAGGWLVFTGARALSAVIDLRGAVVDIQESLESNDLAGLQEAATTAQDAAQRADAALDDPVWAAVAAIPYLGDTAQAGRITASAVATAAEGLPPLLEVSDVLDPETIYVDGRVAIERIAEAAEPLAQASAATQQADQIMATSPTKQEGAWVLAALDDQRETAAEELSAAADALFNAARGAEVMPALLGADGPRTWFVGVQSPAEARGTGGVIGTHVILTADDGYLELERTASNSELARLESLPDFGGDFAARYGRDPELIANTNISPHFPYAGRLWQESYAQSLGTTVDVVMGTDVVAFGDIIEAAGPITLPDGRRVTAQEAVDFGLKGVYEAIPDQNERERYQEDVASAVFTELTEGNIAPVKLVRALGRMIEEKRLQLWSPNEAEQDVLGQMRTSGSVAATPGPYAFPIVINSTASKLDTYVTRDITYEVGRCDLVDRVDSRLSMTLESALPTDTVLPDDVVAQAEVGPDGPISAIFLQTHLSEGAEIVSATVDGVPAASYFFDEEGRPALLLALDLEPRTPVEVVIDFIEPASDRPAEVPDQPLAEPASIEITDVPCVPSG